MKGKGIVVLMLMASFIAIAMAGTVSGKSMYVVAKHHTRQFDAWNIWPPPTVPPITYQATYTLSHANDPADVAVWLDPADPSEGMLFITSEFDYGVELVDVKTMTPLGWVTGAYGLAGIKIDYHTNIVYTVERMTNDLYEYDWDPVAKTLTLKPGYPVDLSNCDPGGALGLALDDITGRLYVADAASGLVRIYDITTLAEVSNFAPSIPPVGIAVDRRRGFVYTSHPDGSCAWLPQYGDYTLLSKYDLGTGVETTVDMGHGGMGIAVDEVTGYVYVTGGCSGYDISIWDSSLDSVYSTGPIGDWWSGGPAGIAIGPSFNPPNLAKNDVVVGYGVYIGQTFTYEITFENTDSLYDMTNVRLVDDLPPELDFVSEAVDSVLGSGMYDPVTHTVTWYIGTVPAGQAGPYVELVVKVNQNAMPNTTIYNYCTIFSDQYKPITVIGRDPDTTDGEGTYINPHVLVEFDIKPQSCPNPFNMGSEGVLPVAILGTEDFDVHSVDPATVRLEGVAPLRWNFEDVTRPVDPRHDSCECTTLGADGYLDMTLKFDHPAIAAALGTVQDREVKVLTLTGMTYDGVPILGKDCVIILKKGNAKLSEEETIAGFSLGDAYPNPFNPETEISFSLPERAEVSLVIYNVLGEKVRTLVNGEMSAGTHTISWKGTDEAGNPVASGIYFYKLSAGDLTATKKMVLTK
jgi:uncharacterized repeat protein (TIGR01451 family)